MLSFFKQEQIKLQFIGFHLYINQIVHLIYAQRANITGYPFTLIRVHLPQIIILISYDQLPFDNCSSVGRATVICSEGRGFKPQCEPISFLGPTLRRYYLGHLLEHFNLPHLVK